LELILPFTFLNYRLVILMALLKSFDLY